MKRVEDLLTTKVINIFLFPVFFPKKRPLVKPDQKNKEPEPPGKYIKKTILEKVLTGFGVLRQKVYKNNKKSNQFQPPENTTAT